MFVTVASPVPATMVCGILIVKSGDDPLIAGAIAGLEDTKMFVEATVGVFTVKFG